MTDTSDQNMQDDYVDWVRIRALCDVPAAFNALVEVVEADVASANKHLPKIEAGIEDLRRSVRTVMVIQANGNGCTFRISGDEIVVRDANEKDVLRAKPKMVEMHLRLAVDGHEEPMRLWEFSRLALEPVFFDKSW